MAKKKIDKSIVCTAIVGLVVVECAAMYLGFNGLLRSTIIAIIATLAGLTIPTPKILEQ